MKATRQYIEALTNALATSEGVSFKEGQGWSTDIKKKTLHYPAQDLLRYDIDTVKGFILHELGHINYTTENEPNEIEKKHPSIRQAYNVLEDVRVEYLQAQKHGDFARIPIVKNNIMGLKAIIEEHSETLKTQPKLVQYLHGLQAYIIPEAQDLALEIGWSKINNIQNETFNILDPEVQEALQNTLRNIGSYGLANASKYASTTTDISKIVINDLLPYIEKFLDESDKQPQEQLSKELEPKKKYGAGYQEPKLRHSSIPSDNELKTLLSPYINTLARRLTDILKEKAQTKYVGAHLQGKLLSKNAFKVLTDDKRIFSKKNTPDKPSYAINVILDASGSMSQLGKHENTYIGAYLLVETCKQMGFTVNLFSMDSTTDEINSLSRYRDMTGGGNSELNALLAVKQKLNKFDDNLIFLLTDGLACDSESEIKQSIYTIQKDFNAQLIAIGIALPARDIEIMQKYYPKSTQAKTPEDLPQTLISTMQNLISR